MGRRHFGLAFGLASVACALAASGAGCADLRLADTPEGGTSADLPDGSPSALDGGAGSDARTPGTDSGFVTSRLYDDVQAALATKRFPGPATPQGSSGYCTSQYFFWKESDGTLHSWLASSKAKIDYGFKVSGSRSYFFPADTFIAVDETSFTNQDVYRTGQTNMMAGMIPYAFNFVSANDGVLRLDQSVNGTDVGGTKVRRWNAASSLTEDITSTVLDTRQPPSSFVNDVLVIPGGVTVPYALWLVDVVKKTTTSVTFDGGLSVFQTEQMNGGLVVSYSRSGGSALRVYRNDADVPSARLEVGDDVANRANILSDGPSGEHKFLAKIATWNHKILYASAYGIWSYDLVTGSLAPVQLSAGKTVGFPDTMCVVRDANLLMYRTSGDTLGQVWAVSLSNLGL